MTLSFNQDSSCGKALEYLEQVLKIYGLIVHKLCEGKKRDDLEDEFQGMVFTVANFFFALPVYYLSEGFKERLESFWSKLRLKPPFRQLKPCWLVFAWI